MHTCDMLNYESNYNNKLNNWPYIEKFIHIFKFIQDLDLKLPNIYILSLK
jgi:hypothetical protein